MELKGDVVEWLHTLAYGPIDASLEVIFNPMMLERESMVITFITQKKQFLYGFKVPSAVYDACKPDIEFKEGNACKPCSEIHKLCTKCTSDKKCSQCKPLAALSGDKLSCACTTTSYLNPGGTGCLACVDEDPNCLKCKRGNDMKMRCQQCKADHILHTYGGKWRCVFDCEKDGKKFKQDGSCIDCRVYQAPGGTCEECKEADGCLRCADSRRMYDKAGNGKMVCTGCTEQQGAIKSIGGCFTCNNPPQRRCKTCSRLVDTLDSFKACLECEDGLVKVPGVSDNSQAQCVVAVKEDECMEDPYKPPYKKCSQSHQNCRKCFKSQCKKFEGGRLRCEQCSGGLSPSTNEADGVGCVAVCRDTEYREKSSNTCRPCAEKT